MLPTTGVDEALASLLDQVRRLEPQSVSLESALGLVLAEPLVSAEAHPADDTSAMDGYAVRTEDLAKAMADTPVYLDLIEDVKAGTPPRLSLASGQTSRISTGALVPTGADAVVMREVVEVVENRIRFDRPAQEAQNIRFTGEHLKAGELVVEKGRTLGAAEIGMAAYLGYQSVQAVPKVTVAVLATGSELVETGGSLQRGQIRDSNGITLASALREIGCEVTRTARVPDTPQALDAALEAAFADSKVVLTSGGISAGWHDLVRQRIERLGGVFRFHKLRMRPGKPLAFGQCGESFFFCLPGNPVSTMVTFEVFVKPALRKMAGLEPYPRTFRARLDEPIEKKEGFTIFFRGVAQRGESGFSVRLTGPQGSHMLKSMVDANVLIRTEETDRLLEAGAQVTILPLKSL